MLRRLGWIAVALMSVGQLASSRLAAQDVQGVGPTIELVDPNVFRVCADPRSMPFSNEKAEGFENKLARLFADKLGKSLSFTFYPQATGFVRLTLNAYKCDIIMGYPQGDPVVQVTNPYYRTAYALVYQPASDLAGVDTLADPRLKGKRIGIVAGTPPGNNMAINGLMGKAKPYALMVDTRYDSPPEMMIKDIASGDIDAGILWGPIAGYYAKRENPALVVVPLVKETSGPHLDYRITMGVRYTDQEWKRTLNRMIAENQSEITKLLLSFGVPLLDDKDRPITETSLNRP